MSSLGYSSARLRPRRAGFRFTHWPDITNTLIQHRSSMNQTQHFFYSQRSMRRWRARMEKYGDKALMDRRRGKPSAKRVPVATIERVLSLYREKYFDFNVKHFHDKLQSEHGVQLSYTWVKQTLQAAGLVQKARKRGCHRRRRPRRPLPGMLLHLDGSHHQWFQDERWYDLIVVLDDATSEIYYAQLVDDELTKTVMAALKQVIEDQGWFCALYSDRASHFFLTPKAGEAVDRHQLTQVGRALRNLDIQMIPAYSPQARGRSERNFGTWQGRLPQELRFRGIKTVGEANQFLRDHYIGNSTPPSRWPLQSLERHSCPMRGGIWTAFSPFNTNGSSTM